MFALVRALTYATLFIGLVLIFVPARLLSWSGVVAPSAVEVPQIIAMIGGGLGAAVALWCVVTFGTAGRGTPAPFDPPRRLVIVGPYRFVRNPMYIGAGLTLGGAALYYGSAVLAGYLALFLVIAHLFVVLYEEPTLRRVFGPEYEEYCRRVRRWLPRA